MPDIGLRFHKDMLVLSAPLEAALSRQGVDVDHDWEMVTLLESETVEDALRMESLAGAQCVVAGTARVTEARLAHTNFQDRAADVARAALAAARTVKPQHVLVEIAPCGLPLDASSKASLNESRAQYAGAARLFAHEEFDAFFLNGFTTCADLKCALMGLQQVSGAPVIASIDVDGEGRLTGGRGESLKDACAVMAEYGASVVGFATAADADSAVRLAERAVAAVDLPVLVQLVVRERNPKQGGPTAENPYFRADTMVEAAERLRGAGVQFLRAAGSASPAYTGALMATVAGHDVALNVSAATDDATSTARADAGEDDASPASAAPAIDFDSPEMADLIAATRAHIADIVKGGA